MLQRDNEKQDTEGAFSTSVPRKDDIATPRQIIHRSKRNRMLPVDSLAPNKVPLQRSPAMTFGISHACYWMVKLISVTCHRSLGVKRLD